MVLLKQPCNLGTAGKISTLQRQFPCSTAPAVATACKPSSMEIRLCTETFRCARGKG